jgi:putative salt-induced outer membrane protein YdiY
MNKRLILLAAFAATTIGVLAQSAPTTTETNSWKTSAAAGLTLAKGNSDTLLITANIASSRKWGMNEADLGADGTYGKSDGTKNSDAIHGFGQYNRLFSERIFGLFRVDALHDEIADIDYRLTVSPGIGYYFIKNGKTFLRGEVGPSLVTQSLGGVSDTFATLRLAERFEHTFNERTKLWQSVEWLPQVDRFQNSIINAELGVDVAMSAKLHLRTFVQDTYNTEPATGRKKNDIKLVSALAYTF